MLLIVDRQMALYNGILINAYGTVPCSLTVLPSDAAQDIWDVP